MIDLLIPDSLIVDIDCIGHDGASPIYIAAKSNSVLALQLLIDYHGSTTITNANGETPLHPASRLGNIDICKVFPSNLCLCRHNLLFILLD